MERWADEQAARATGDRTRVARAVGKAALAAHGTPALPRLSDALPFRGRRDPLSTAGPVPRRVAALLAPPLTRRPGLALATAGLLALTVVSTAAATRDLDALLEVVGVEHHHGPHHLDMERPDAHGMG